jgi:hypothetical protein
VGAYASESFDPQLRITVAPREGTSHFDEEKLGSDRSVPASEEPAEERYAGKVMLVAWLGRREPDVRIDRE